MMNKRRQVWMYILFLLFAEHAGAQVISAEENYAINSPGVVMVQTVFSATVYVNKVDINEKKFKQLVDSVKRMDTTGNMFSAEEKLDIVVKALYNNPFKYFSATTEYFRQKHRIVSSGTGFFVTGDGYLITNCHIIDRDSAFIRRQFFLSTFQDVTEANIKALQSSWEMTMTDQQRNLLSNAYSAIYSQVSSMILFDLKREIYVQYRINSNNKQVLHERRPAKVIIKGAAMPGKDVAILKIDSVVQLPVLTLSNEMATRIGEQVLVFGYPEPVTSNAFLAKETGMEPSLTSGIVSAIKKSIGGWPVMQMDAVISHGSSGSPVCNNKGQVTGLATFGSLEQNGGSLAAGFNFAIPLSVIKEFLDSVKLRPQVSQSTALYNNALKLFQDGYYNKALKKLEAVKKLNAAYPQLNFYLDECNRRITAGEDEDSSAQRLIFRIMAAILVIGGVILFYRWKNESVTKK